MRRGIGRLRAGGGGFSPISVFAGGAAGLWLDPSDITTGFQDSAGTTPQTATGQPTGKRLDKSGRGNHFLQATTTSRPIYNVAGAISSDTPDGVDDGYATGAGITLINGMDCFYAVKLNSAASMLLGSSTGGGSKFFGVMDATASLAADTVGSAYTTWVDGVQVGGTANTTRTQLQTAMGSGTWRVFELHDLDLSTWTQFTIGLYASFMLSADVAQLIVCPGQSASVRNQLRTYCGAKVGRTL